MFGCLNGRKTSKSFERQIDGTKNLLCLSRFRSAGVDPSRTAHRIRGPERARNALENNPASSSRRIR